MVAVWNHRPLAAKPYRAQWHDTLSTPGKRRVGGSATFADPDEARAWAQEQERKHAAIYGQKTKGPRYLEEFASEWLGTLTHSASTIRGYRSQVRQLVDYFGVKTPLTAIEQEDVIHYLVHCSKVLNLTPGSVKVRATVLKALLGYAVKHRYMSSNPAEDVDLPRYVDRDAQIISEEQLSALVVELPERSRGAVELAWATGMRISEVCGLRVTSVDLNAKRVRISDVTLHDGTEQSYAKNGRRDQWVKLSDVAASKLRAHRQRFAPSADGHVFTLHRGGQIQPLSQATLRNHFRAACKAAGLSPETRFHDLRHSAATILAENDAPANVIRTQLRHARLDTSQKYIRHADDEQLSRWLNKPRTERGGPEGRASA